MVEKEQSEHFLSEISILCILVPRPLTGGALIVTQQSVVWERTILQPNSYSFGNKGRGIRVEYTDCFQNHGWEANVWGSLTTSNYLLEQDYLRVLSF